ITPQAGGTSYSQTLYPFTNVILQPGGGFGSSGFRYGAGFLLISGTSTGNQSPPMVAYRLGANLVPTPYDLGNSLSAYYRGVTGYAAPQYATMMDGAIYQ